jgi:hypothetical protein
MRSLLEERDDVEPAEPRWIVHLRDATTGERFEIGPDLTAEARAAAALLLAAGGRHVDPAPLSVLAPPDGDPVAWARQQLRGRAFAALASRLESRVREMILVPAGVAPQE